MSTSKILSKISSDSASRDRFLALLRSYSSLVTFRPSEEKIKCEAIRITEAVAEGSDIEELDEEFSRVCLDYMKSLENPILYESFVTLMLNSEDENWELRRNMIVELLAKPEFDINDDELETLIQLTTALTHFTLSRTSIHGIFARALRVNPLDWSKEFRNLVQFVVQRLNPAEYDDLLIDQFNWMVTYSDTRVFKAPGRLLTPFMPPKTPVEESTVNEDSREDSVPITRSYARSE